MDWTRGGIGDRKFAWFTMSMGRSPSRLPFTMASKACVMSGEMSYGVPRNDWMSRSDRDNPPSSVLIPSSPDWSTTAATVFMFSAPRMVVMITFSSRFWSSSQFQPPSAVRND